jgi:hypothetical protein
MNWRKVISMMDEKSIEGTRKRRKRQNDRMDRIGRPFGGHLVRARNSVARATVRSQLVLTYPVHPVHPVMKTLPRNAVASSGLDRASAHHGCKSLIFEVFLAFSRMSCCLGRAIVLVAVGCVSRPASARKGKTGNVFGETPTTAVDPSPPRFDATRTTALPMVRIPEHSRLFAFIRGCMVHRMKVQNHLTQVVDFHYSFTYFSHVFDRAR